MAKTVCPYWLGYFLVSPLRRLIQDPEKILRPYVKPGMTALDFGSGMGYFSLPLALMVGPKGRVICVDLQEEMIQGLKKRARKAGVADRIVTRLSPPDSFGLMEFKAEVDFALAFAVLHELAGIRPFFGELAPAMKPGGVCLVAEPRGHVTLDEFHATLSTAVEKGFSVVASPQIVWSHTALLKKAA